MARLGLIVFLALITAPGAAWLLGVRPVLDENRKQVAIPAPTLTAVASTEWFETVEQGVLQGLPLRQSAVDGKRLLLVDVLNEKRFDNVLIGGDRFLFLHRPLRNWCGWSEPSVMAQRANRRLLEIVPSDKPMLWVTVPDKQLVHGDRLARRFQPWLACARERRGRYRDAMHKDLGDRFIDLLPAIQELPVSDVPAYERRDTHWTPDTALALPRAILDAWAPALWKETDLRPGKASKRTPDLARQLGLREVDMPVSWIAQRQGIKQDALEQVELATRRGVRRQLNTAIDQTPLVAGQTLLIHDSFLLPVMGALSPYFEELVVVQWEDLNSERHQQLLEQADRVIYQSVERLTPERQARIARRW